MLIERLFAYNHFRERSSHNLAFDETHQYLNLLLTYKPGDQLTLGVLRNGKNISVQITLSQASTGG